MKVAATLMAGLLVGCLVVAGLDVFKNAVAAQAVQWVAQHPQPEITLARRAILSTGNFVASYLIFASLFILPLSIGIAGVVAYRRECAAQQPARANEGAFAEPYRRPFVVAVSTVFLEAAVLSLPIGLLLVWLGRGSLRSPLTLPGMDLYSFVFPLSSLVGTLIALISALRKRRRQFVLELAFGVALLALSYALDFLLPQLLRAG
jgi:hypothetical protein